jgi:uncharacterized protein (TIGR03083 family)
VTAVKAALSRKYGGVVPGGNPVVESCGRLMPLPVVDTRQAFRPLSAEIVSLLRSLGAADWERPTVAGSWQVRDIVAHLTDTAFRRLSLQRDGLAMAGPASDQDFVAFINELNATWTRAARRLSPRVLTELYAEASGALAGFIEALDLDADAFFAVSWAGEARSRQWLDIGREFTEVWHHGAQIRDAVGAGPFSDPEWLRAVLRIAMHVLPHAYGTLAAPRGASIAIRVTGPASGAWTLRRDQDRWVADEGDAVDPTASLTMADEVAWRLLFNALSPVDNRALVRIDGDAALARPLLRARAVIV